MPSTPRIAILIMAAGQSRRMGQDKLMQHYPDGQTVLEERIATARKVGHEIYVAVGAGQSSRISAIARTSAKPLLCQNPELGLGYNMALAVGQLPAELDGVLILLADMPALTAEDIQAVCSAFDPEQIARGATSAGKAGHPVLIPAKFLNVLKSLEGDRGAQIVLKGLPTQLVTLPADHASFDVDTPEEWQHWLDRV